MTEYYHTECLFERYRDGTLAGDRAAANFTATAQGPYIHESNGLRRICSGCLRSIQTGEEYWARPL